MVAISRDWPNKKNQKYLSQTNQPQARLEKDQCALGREMGHYKSECPHADRKNEDRASIWQDQIDRVRAMDQWALGSPWSQEKSVGKTLWFMEDTGAAHSVLTEPLDPPPPLEKNYHLRGHRESKKWTLDEVLWLILFLPCWIVHIPWLVETCWKKLVPSWSIHILINPSAYSLVEDYNMTEQNNEKLGVCDPLLTEIMLKFPGVRA